MHTIPTDWAEKSCWTSAVTRGGTASSLPNWALKSCLGFDARQHWIDQALLCTSLYPHLLNVSFQVSNVEDYLQQSGQVDVVIFKGVLYHLPDPIHVLLQLCRMTREVIYINTETDLTVPEHCLSYRPESATHLMSGVDGLAWWPGGPAARFSRYWNTRDSKSTCQVGTATKRPAQAGSQSSANESNRLWKVKRRTRSPQWLQIPLAMFAGPQSQDRTCCPEPDFCSVTGRRWMHADSHRSAEGGAVGDRLSLVATSPVGRHRLRPCLAPRAQNMEATWFRDPTCFYLGPTTW